MSQTEAIAAHLKRGKSLTALEALRKFRCLRLAGRIYELRAAGMSIYSRTVTRGGKRVAEYGIKRALFT